MFEVSNYSGKVKRNGVIISFDENNQDYQDFLIAKESNEGIVYVEIFEEENAVIQNELILEFLKNMIAKVELYITAMAMGKNVRDNLKYYELAYTTKYNLCKQYLLDSTVDPYNTLETEAQLEGFPSLSEYINLVVTKFEIGKTFRDRGVQLIECLRKRIYADLDAGNYELANNRLKIIDDLPADVTAGQVGAIYQQVMTLQNE